MPPCLWYKISTSVSKRKIALNTTLVLVWKIEYNVIKYKIEISYLEKILPILSNYYIKILLFLILTFTSTSCNGLQSCGISMLNIS